MLHGMVAQHVSVKEVRLIRDKYTGTARGFSFMEFHSIADAAKALHLLQVGLASCHPCMPNVN